MNGGSRLPSSGQSQGYGMSRMSSIGIGSARQSLGPPRMSLAPRGGPGGGIGGMAGLADGMNGMSLGQGRNSDVRMSGIGRSMGNMSRRSSQYAGRPSTIGAAGMSAKLTKDPRPIREKSWQGNAIRGLIGFLVERGYNQPLSVKALQAPSATAFESIFKFLYGQLDPDFVFQKKFEEEVPGILKGLRYPYADSIKQSQLHSVGSMHTWPTVLAMLTWITELIHCCEVMDDENDIDDGTGLQEDLHPEKIFFNYVTEAYSVFLQGDDNYDAMDRQLMDRFDRKFDKDVRALEKLEDERCALEKEWTHLTESECPVIVLEKEGKILKEDKEKFIQYIRHVENKIQKLKDAVLALKEDLEIKEKEAEQLGEEKASLQRTVDAQEISPADVDRMTAEREQLNQTLQAVAAKMDVANKLLWEKEISHQKNMDGLEKVIQEYNALAYQLGLLGADAVDPALSVELELRVHASRPDQMVSIDLRSKAKPALMELRTRFNNVHHRAQNELIALQESLDNLAWAHAQKKEELVEMEAKVKQLTDRYKEEQDQIGIANTASNEEIQQYERNIQRIKIESNGALIQSQQQMQKAVVEYDQLSRKCTAHRERQLNDLAQSLVDVFNFHQHVRTKLEELHKETESHYQDAIESC
ncbi:HEC/Ndc80p family-domain-containing protein [Powellomyces hirtus]|nr:HEC/Ndc80p family-domain-containing protein [Powellomyces hirtus]